MTAVFFMNTPTFQEIIFTLQRYWDRQGCAILQPYDMEVGAGTSHTATFLRAGTRTVESGLCTAVAAAKGRPLWRQSEPLAALLPIPGGTEARTQKYS